MMLIKNTKELSQGPIKVLVYGESGSGKTSLAKTLPGAPKDVLVVSAESGLLPLKDSGIDYIDITRDQENALLPREKRLDVLLEAYKYLLTDEAKSKYKWVVIDSLSEIQQCLMEALRLKHLNSKDNFAVYRDNLEKMSSIVKMFRDLPSFNVLMICLSERDKDDNGKIFQNFALTGKIASLIPQFFDQVMYLVADNEGKRLLFCDKTDKVFAKDRSGRLNKIEDANMDVIVAKIREEKKDATGENTKGGSNGSKTDPAKPANTGAAAATQTAAVQNPGTGRAVANEPTVSSGARV